MVGAGVVTKARRRGDPRGAMEDGGGEDEDAGGDDATKGAARSVGLSVPVGVGDTRLLHFFAASHRSSFCLVQRGKV